ncbi:hypothetical protein Poly51_21220 [Rubripirellula tenax]|uniref:Uncharacterized protein n=1 Tax=Rubripirellula tenax TaxID=2528015 RepID=A0A5C6FGM8_9BACT|nr:hypothetical protein [Rubripirellula tenax]TWU59334.1 hypothetical protein Poly51_21220 [Rubripirellula tenax]
MNSQDPMNSQDAMNDLASKSAYELMSDDDQCSLYLLGELSASDRSTFEERLATSSELSDRLMRHADLILAVADSSMASAPAAVVTPTRETSHRSLVATILAIAVCLAAIVTGIKMRNSGANEELQIAQAWVDNLTFVNVAGSDLSESDVERAVEDSGTEDSMDAALSWMVAAVAAEVRIPADKATMPASVSESHDEG